MQQVDTKEVEDNLVRQNICIACYQQPKSLDELTILLGIPKAYLEFDLKWLVEHEFVAFEKGKYSTTFYINSRSEMQKSYGVHCDLKEQRFDLAKLVEKGFVEIKGDRAIPRFAVFTEEQFKRLEQEVFEPIVQKLRPGYEMLRDKLTKFYQDKLPVQLKSIHKLPLRQALHDMGYVTTVLAFKEGKLYVPKDAADGEFLTLLYVKEE